MQDKLWQRRLETEEADKKVALREKDVTIKGLLNERNLLNLLRTPETKAAINDLAEKLAASDTAHAEMTLRLKDTTDDLHTMLGSLREEDWPDMKTVEYPAAEIEQRDADMAAYVLAQEAAATPSREDVKNLLHQFAAVAGFEVSDE